MNRSDFPARYALTRRFTLGAPRSLTISPDGNRVAFLRSTSGEDAVNRLWVHDVASGKASIVADPFDLVGEGDSSADVPPEEKARRERAREASGGIVAYSTDPDVKRAYFALAGRLFSTDLSSGETARLPTVDGVVDPRPGPTSSTVCYVATGNLYVTSLRDGDRMVAGSSDPDITYGLPEFVAAEEMGRSRGYWWSPEGTRILAARVDTTGVEQWHISSPVDPAASPRTTRYPRAGTNNASVGLEIHHVDGASLDVEWNPAGEWEYLADASWAPRDQPTLTVQTRDQATTGVLDVNSQTGSVTELYRWSDSCWTELVPGAPAWVGHRLLTVEDRGAARRLVLDGESLTGDDMQVRRVSQADEAGILAVVSFDPMEQHLVHVDTDSTVHRLTEDPGMHSAVTAGDAVAITSTTMDNDGSRVVIWSNGEQVGLIDDLSEPAGRSLHINFANYGVDELRTAVLLPEGATPDTPLPVLLDPYAGPHAQRVLRSRGAYGPPQWFADQGFAVVIADGRGTPGRNPGFERAVWGDLAGPVLDDQLAALDAVAGDYPGLDLGRVGIKGWSFGGYLAALAVLERPDRFHAAVAGAPVTTWSLYDTHYTERYLGHPDHHPDHYHRTDLVEKASSLSRPLLLIHGLADDNVVAAHTLLLSQALLASGRSHNVLPLSGVTHMTPQEVVAENLLRLQLEFLQDHLCPLRVGGS
ncbi:MAG: prolyl oligopeptidase family serine peptidase [Acidimicrobiales bacterium]